MTKIAQLLAKKKKLGSIVSSLKVKYQLRKKARERNPEFRSQFLFYVSFDKITFRNILFSSSCAHHHMQWFACMLKRRLRLCSVFI